MSEVARRSSGADQDPAWIPMSRMVSRLGASHGRDVQAVWRTLIEQHNGGGSTTVDGAPVATAVRKVDGVSRLFVHEVSAHVVERAALKVARVRMDNEIESFMARGAERDAAPAPGF